MVFGAQFMACATGFGDFARDGRFLPRLLWKCATGFIPWAEGWVFCSAGFIARGPSGIPADNPAPPCRAKLGAANAAVCAGNAEIVPALAAVPMAKKK